MSAISWATLEPLQQALFRSGLTLVILGCIVSGCVPQDLHRRHQSASYCGSKEVFALATAQSVVATWAYVSAALAIAGGAILIDAFKTLDQMRAKFEGRVGCCGSITTSATSCCAPVQAFGVLVACIVFCALAIVYGIGALISGLRTMEYIGPNCKNIVTYYYYTCAQIQSDLRYIIVTAALTAVLSAITLLAALAAIRRLQQLRANGVIALSGGCGESACCAAPPPSPVSAAPPVLLVGGAGGVGSGGGSYIPYAVPVQQQQYAYAPAHQLQSMPLQPQSQHMPYAVQAQAPPGMYTASPVWSAPLAQQQQYIPGAMSSGLVSSGGHYQPQMLPQAEPGLQHQQQAYPQPQQKYHEQQKPQF